MPLVLLPGSERNGRRAHEGEREGVCGLGQSLSAAGVVWRIGGAAISSANDDDDGGGGGGRDDDEDWEAGCISVVCVEHV